MYETLKGTGQNEVNKMNNEDKKIKKVAQKSIVCPPNHNMHTQSVHLCRERRSQSSSRPFARKSIQ